MHLDGLPMPKLYAIIKIFTSKPSQLHEKCNRSATAKFQIGLLLTTTTRKQSRIGERGQFPEGKRQICKVAIPVDEYRFSSSRLAIASYPDSHRSLKSIGSPSIHAKLSHEVPE